MRVAIFSSEARENIAVTTLQNITSFERGDGESHEVTTPGAR